MSFFYLKPVKGEIPIHMLETIIERRLEYLQAIFKGDKLTYNEYMAEGSIYDNVGHFMLCIVVPLSKNSDFFHFFLKAETELFKHRLRTLSAYDMRRFNKRILNVIKNKEDMQLYCPLQILCQHLILKAVAHHVCAQSHDTNCLLHCIKLNFKDCLIFVARRQVELRNGIAEVPCGIWIEYFTSLFATSLRDRLNINLTPLINDPRITSLISYVTKYIHFFTNTTNAEILKSRNVDETSLLFPPCMLNLHRNLRNKHRLSHTQRFYYSLFLKDIGMPVDEAIEFWRSEYRQNKNGHHSCCHTWESDEKKYLYGIRHMYGLEGGRKNYTSVNCHRIQSADSASSEGGCPFKHFDPSRRLQLLNTSDNVLSQINNLINRRQYTLACGSYLKSLLKTKPCDNAYFNFTPVKYFMIASESCLQ